MLQAIGLRGHKHHFAWQNTSHSSAGDISKFTVETTSDSRTVSTNDSVPRAGLSYGLPSVYRTPGFKQEYKQDSDAPKNTKFVSVFSLLCNTSTVFSALRKHHEPEAEDNKWWNFDTTLSSVHEAEKEIVFETEADEASDGGEEDGDVFDSFCSTPSNKIMRQPFELVPRTALFLPTVSEEANNDEEDITFFPRLEKRESVKRHRTGFSRNRGDPTPSRNNVLGACSLLSISGTSDMLPVERSFQHLRFMTPEDFDMHESAVTKSSRAQYDVSTSSCTLASMVHEVNATHFAENQNTTSISSASFVFRRTRASSESKEANSILGIDRHATMKKKSSRLGSLCKRLSSPFRSSSGKKNVSYSLSKGKNGMSKQERLYASSLLPSKPLLSKKERTMTSSVVPRPIPQQHFDQPLSILLLNHALKIFEIVLVDFFHETTIGDALAKARAAASAKALSGQKYVSLCNRKLELAAPMLPVSLLVDTVHNDADRPFSSSEKRKLMEMRLLVAVPAGSSAKDCQHIRRVLWKNPKLQRWWKRSDPFSHPDESDDESDDDGLFNAAAAADQEHTVKPSSRSVRKHKHRNERYQRLDD